MVKDKILLSSIRELEAWAFALCDADTTEEREIAIRQLKRALKTYDLAVRLVGKNPLLKQQTC